MLGGEEGWGGGGGEGLDFGLFKCWATFVLCPYFFFTDHCCAHVLVLHVITSIAVC